MHGVMGFGVLGLVFKLQKWDESALFFDGCSLGTLPFLCHSAQPMPHPRTRLWQS